MPEWVDQCVKALMKDPDFSPEDPEQTKEQAAWAVCQARYKQRAEGSVITLETISEPVSFVVAADDGGELLRFRDAILVVAEENQNKDVILEEELQNLAATLPGRAIDYDHQWQKTIGVFTEAHVVQVGGTWGLSVGGLIWADRFPEEARDVRQGKLKLSIEADATTAECSICGGIFQRALDYCEHLLGKTASRILHGLKAVGGGLTRNPAGTGTEFDLSNVYFVAHHKLEGNREIVVDKSKSEEEEQMDELEKLRAQLEEMTAERDRLVAEREKELAELGDKVSTLTAKVEELTGKLKEAEEEKAEIIAAHRKDILRMNGLEDDELEEQAETFGTMTDAQFELLVAHVSKPTKDPKPGVTGGFTPGSDGDTDDKDVLTL